MEIVCGKIFNSDLTAKVAKFYAKFANNYAYFLAKL
jgi:hypothetical protein